MRANSDVAIPLGIRSARSSILFAAASPGRCVIRNVVGISQIQEGIGKSRIMETKPPVPRAILVGVQLPDVDDVAHAADLEELGRLVKTLGYKLVGTISQKRDEIDGATVLGKGRLAELAAITGGTGVVGSMARARKSKARDRFEYADGKKPNASQIEPDPER